MRKCNHCNKEKTESEFSIFRGRMNKWCKSCREYHNNNYKKIGGRARLQRKEYYQKNKELFTARHFKNNLKTYGLSIEEYKTMIKNQNNRCPICEKEFVKDERKTYPCVDHSHETGRVRAILCRQCNISLHYIEDFAYFDKAIKYLNKYLI